MRLTCEFDNLEEMVQFANLITVNVDMTQGEGMNHPETPDQVAEPAQTVPYSAQIVAATQLTPQEMTGHPAPAETAPVTVQQTQVPTATREYTLDELAGAAMTLMDKGMQVQLQELLSGYGVEALPMLPKEQFGNFATALRGMGAQI